jgi:hypothetical protein
MAVALSVTGVKQSIVTSASGAVKLGKEAEPERSFFQRLTCSPASALLPASERRTLWSGLTFEVKQGTCCFVRVEGNAVHSISCLW